MKQTINFGDFNKSFISLRPDNFTYAGRRALFEFLEWIEEDAGEEIEFDMIALCCDYTEYKNLAEVQKNYGNIKTMADLEWYTTVILIEGTEGIIIQDF